MRKVGPDHFQTICNEVVLAQKELEGCKTDGKKEEEKKGEEVEMKMTPGEQVE